MSLSASRSARAAAFVADTLLLAPVLALVFYPGYAFWLPEPPKPPTLPLNLVTPEEQLRYFGALATRNLSLASLALVAVCVFAVFLFLYTARTLRQSGQTFGMRASSIHVTGHTGEVSLPTLLLRSLLSALVSAGLVGGLVGLGVSWLLLETPGILEIPAWIVPTSLGGIALPLLCVLPRKSPSDLLGSTLQRTRGSVKQG